MKVPSPNIEVRVRTPAQTFPSWDTVIPTQNGQVGAAFSLDLDTVCTDAAGLNSTYSITASSVPGLALSGTRNRILSGTPTTQGLFTVEFEANDAVNAAPTWNQAIVVRFTEGVASTYPPSGTLQSNGIVSDVDGDPISVTKSGPAVSGVTVNGNGTTGTSLSYNGVGIPVTSTGHGFSANDGQGHVVPSASFSIEIVSGVTTAVGVQGRMFTINGAQTFILMLSYFDFMQWKVQDFIDMKARGWNGIRVWCEKWAGSPAPSVAALNSVGQFTGQATFLAGIRSAAAHGIVVLVTIMDWESSPFQTQPLTAIDNVVNALENEPNVLIDIVNEHQHNNGVYAPQSLMKTYRDRAKAADSGCIVTVSSCGDHPGPFDAMGETIQSAYLTAHVNTVGVDFLEHHDARTSDWADKTDQRMTKILNHFSAIGVNKPAAFGEPNRRSGGSGPSEAEFLQAARECKAAGGAMWCFHQTASFNMDGPTTFYNRLDSVEKNVFDNAAASLSGFSLDAAGRSGRQWYGSNDHLGIGIHGDHLGSALAARTMNLRAIRDIFHWQESEQSLGVFGFRPSGGHPWAASMFAQAADFRANGYDIHYQIGSAYPYTPLRGANVPDPAFRQLFVNYVVDQVQQWLAAGNRADRLTICVSNESNEISFGDYGYDFNDTVPQIQTYGALCKEVRAAVRAINPLVRVMVFDGANGSHDLYANWHIAIKGTPGFWAQAGDCVTTHEYNIDPYPAIGTPETLYPRTLAWAQTLMNDAAANGRPDITTGITESGFSSNQITDAEIVKSYARWLFLASVIPGLEFFHTYGLRSDPGLGLDLLSGANALVANRAFAVRDACAYLNRAYERDKWNGVGGNGDVGILMHMPAASGGQALALWNLPGRNLTGVQCEADRAGTLRIQTIAGATTTTALQAGMNTVPAIALNDTPKVLHTTDGTRSGSRRSPGRACVTPTSRSGEWGPTGGSTSTRSRSAASTATTSACSPAMARCRSTPRSRLPARARCASISRPRAATAATGSRIIRPISRSCSVRTRSTTSSGP